MSCAVALQANEYNGSQRERQGHQPLEQLLKVHVEGQAEIVNKGDFVLVPHLKVDGGRGACLGAGYLQSVDAWLGEVLAGADHRGVAVQQMLCADTLQGMATMKTSLPLQTAHMPCRHRPTTAPLPGIGNGIHALQWLHSNTLSAHRLLDVTQNSPAASLLDLKQRGLSLTRCRAAAAPT